MKARQKNDRGRGLRLAAGADGRDRHHFTQLRRSAYDRNPSSEALLGLGLIAGGPAVAGALLGGSVSSSELAAALIGIGVGAILQVVVQLVPAMKDGAGKLLTPVTSAAIAAGALALYLTGLLVTV
jgi:hypothetical protein